MPNPYGQFVPDPLAPSGYRWQRHGEQPATSMLPPVTPTEVGASHPRANEEAPAVAPPRLAGQDDLSEYDSDPTLEIVPTEKFGPLDEVLIQPPQDPDWRPGGTT